MHHITVHGAGGNDGLLLNPPLLESGHWLPKPISAKKQKKINLFTYSLKKWIDQYNYLPLPQRDWIPVWSWTVEQIPELSQKWALFHE